MRFLYRCCAALLALLLCTCVITGSVAETVNRFYYETLDEAQKIYYDYLFTSSIGDDMLSPGKLRLPVDLNLYDSYGMLTVAFGAYKGDNPEASAWLFSADCMNSDESYYVYEKLVDRLTGEVFNIPYPDPNCVCVELMRNPYATDESVVLMSRIYDRIAEYFGSFDNKVVCAAGLAAFLNQYLEYDYAAVDNGLDLWGHRTINDDDDGIVVSRFVFGEMSEQDLTTAMCVNGRKAICSGFANAFKAICDRIGLPCLYLTSEDHAFNAIRLDDGLWYIIEPQGGIEFMGLKEISADAHYNPSTFCGLDEDQVGFIWGLPPIAEEGFMYILPYSDTESLITELDEMRNGG